MSQNSASGLPPELDHALRQHPDGARLSGLWVALGNTTPAPIQEITRARNWAGIEARMAAAPVISPRRQIRGRILLTLAAAAALLITVAGIRWTTGHAIRVPPGERKTVTLPDGSAVDLAGGSVLRWRRNLGTTGYRDVEFEGSAFFSVVSAGRPFRVTAGSAHITVLGTRFAVDVGRSGAEVSVAVEEGRVAVAGRDRSARVVLGAGQRTVVDRNGGPTRPDTIATAHLAPWRTGGFAAVDEPLELIFERLARQYGMEVDLRNERAAQLRLSLYYPGTTSLETIVRDLATARDLTWRKTARGFVLE